MLASRGEEYQRDVGVRSATSVTAGTHPRPWVCSLDTVLEELARSASLCLGAEGGEGCDYRSRDLVTQ